MPDRPAAPESSEPTPVDRCPECGGVGWYVDHPPECYEAEECVGCGGVQVQCERCRRTGSLAEDAS